MWSLARFKLLRMIAGTGIALLSLIVGGTAHAQAQAGEAAVIGASTIMTNFSSSTASVIDIQNDAFLVVFHIRNTGELTSKDTTLSLVLPLGWEYHGTSGTIDHILVQDRAYGQLISLQLAPIGQDQKKEVAVSISRQNAGSDSDSFFAALTSQFSSPIYTTLSPAQTADKHAFWTSWFRSSFEYLMRMLNEIWSRFLFTVRYTSS